MNQGKWIKVQKKSQGVAHLQKETEKKSHNSSMIQPFLGNFGTDCRDAPSESIWKPGRKENGGRFVGDAQKAICHHEPVVDHHQTKPGRPIFFLEVEPSKLGALLYCRLKFLLCKKNADPFHVNRWYFSWFPDVHLFYLWFAIGSCGVTGFF